MKLASPWSLAPLGWALSSCAPPAAFSCEQDSDCDGGLCQPTGYCSFADDSCPSGQRYGMHSGGDYSSVCVEVEGGGTAASDDESPDSSSPEDDGDTTSTSSSIATGDSADETVGTSDPETSGDGMDTGSTVDPTWWHCDWAARRSLSLDIPASAVGLADFPILIAVNDTRVDYTIMHPTGDDLRIIGSDGQTPLPLEIERWDPSGVSFAWTTIPVLEADMTLTMYYGNAAADPTSRDGLWIDHAAVWHLSNEGIDASGAGSHGTLEGATETSGQVARAQQFPGALAGMMVAAQPSVDNLFDGGGTLSAWVRLDAFSNETIVAAKSNNFNADGGWVFLIEPGRLLFGRGFAQGRGRWHTTDGSVPLLSWVHVAVSFDDLFASTPTVYVNGQPQELVMEGGVSPSGVGDDDSGAPLLIAGDVDDLGRTLDGRLDEVRMSTVLRPPEWIALDDASMRDAVVVFGPADHGCED